MVNPASNVGFQEFAAKPAVVNAPDPPARTESVQPRQAPAADSQRGDQKHLASRDEQPKPESDRGSKVDVSA